MVNQICLFVLYVFVVGTESSNSTTTKTNNSKEIEKFPYPKKVNYLQKNQLKTALKKVTDITDKFKDLPPDDLSFIKELDKQFKLHGGEVKIKVENKNVTEIKNSKRTIDRDLGYGYQFNRPKFMFYPYSQQDIGGNNPNYFFTGDGKTEVSVEPSYSYELKSKSYIAHNEPQIDIPKSKFLQHEKHFSQKQQQYEEPVIVLRIPGPAKYATHLQMLLQKYLEIRAAQYLHILEEAEKGNMQQQQQLEQLDYNYGNNAIGHVENVKQHQQHLTIPEQHDYTQQLHYDSQNTVTPQSVQYETENVYQNYKHMYSSQHKKTQPELHDAQSYYSSQQSAVEQHALRNDHQAQYQQNEQYQYPEEQFQYKQQMQEQPQFYYTHQQQYVQPENLPTNTYHQVFLVSMVPQVQPDHKYSLTQQEEQRVMEDKSNPNEHSLSSPVAENNPRLSHTRVVFTNKNEYHSNEYQMYQLPSIKPNDRHAPTSKPDYHQDFQHQQESSAHYKQYYNTANTAIPEVVAITQRPYNYHADRVKNRARGKTTQNKTAPTSGESDKSLQKIREYVRDKLGAETGRAVEFKTTQIIDRRSN